MKMVKETLIAARALINTPDKWFKNHPGTTRCRCTWAAIADVAKSREGTKEACRALSAHVPKSMYNPANVESNVIRFNDLPSTTHADVMALFDRTIASLNEEAKRIGE